VTEPLLSRRSVIKALRALSERRLTQTEARALAEGKTEKQDFAAAILGAARLDSTLAYIIEREFIDLSPDEERALLREGPLAEFGAKIKLGYALGLYGPLTRDDLNIIREIRNAFAHSGNPLDFSNAAIARACQLINISADFRYPDPPFDTSLKFCMATSHLIVNMIEYAHRGDKSRVP
jgi:hypothetical protein